MKLILTGLMGSGKTTVGKLLAAKLGWNFIDTDEYINHRHGPVKNLFAQTDGEHRFRIIEERVAASLSDMDEIVVSTGGRFFLNRKNIERLEKNSTIFCLEAELPELVDRLNHCSGNTYRPRFSQAVDKHALMQTLKTQSDPFYRQFNKIQTTLTSPEKVATEILIKFKPNSNTD